MRFLRSNWGWISGMVGFLFIASGFIYGVNAQVEKNTHDVDELMTIKQKHENEYHELKEEIIKVKTKQDYIIKGVDNINNKLDNKFK